MRKKLRLSVNCWRAVSEFLTYSDHLRLQLVNRYFYEEIVPTMTYWNRMFPRINNELQYFRANDFIWYSLELGGELTVKPQIRNKKEVTELVFDNKRQPQPLFVCSQF